MKYTFALLALAASVFAQGVPTGIAPSSPAPSGCQLTVSGTFEINVVNVTLTSKRDLTKRVTACGGPGTLVLTLNNGILLDSQQRIGSIVANRQFQFDNPPQAGAVYTGGWSNCANDTLAIGGSAIFYQCLSGTFYNIYDQAIGGQCTPVYIDTIPCVATSGSATAAPVTTSLTSTPSAIASPPSLSISPITTVTVSTTSTTSSSTSTTSSTTSITSSTRPSIVSVPSVASNSSTPIITTSTVVIVTSAYTNTTLSGTAPPVTRSSSSRSTSASASSTQTISSFPSNAAGILAKNNEFIALAAGVAALVMF